MAGFTISSTSQVVNGTSDSDSFQFASGSSNFTFAGSVSGGDGADALVFAAASAPAITPLGRLTTVSVQGAALSSLEALTFASQTGDWLVAWADFNDFGTGISANASITGGNGRDALIISIAAAGVYQMPSFSFAAGWGTNLAAPGLMDYVLLSATDAGEHTLIANDDVAGFQVLTGGTGADILIGGNSRDILTGKTGASDLMSGNAGDDLFQFDGAPAGQLSQMSALIDGGEGLDRLLITGAVQLDGTAMSGVEGIRLGLGTAASLTISADMLGDAPQLTLEGSGSLAIVMDEPGRIDLSGLVMAAGADISLSISASSGTDQIFGGALDDVLDGLDGDDRLIGRLGDDQLIGGAGNDWLHGGEGDDYLVGDSGNDDLNGGSGHDTASYANLFRFVLPSDPQPNGVRVDLRIKTEQNTLLGGTDRLRWIENVEGSRYNDILIGDHKDNVLSGGDGADVLGGAGGADVLVGGLGNDSFVFAVLADSRVKVGNRDTIVDFNRQQGDRLILSFMDANSLIDGDQAFVLGGSLFTGLAGELIQTTDAFGLLVQGDVDGNRRADFSILMFGQPGPLDVTSIIL